MHTSAATLPKNTIPDVPHTQQRRNKKRLVADFRGDNHSGGRAKSVQEIYGRFWCAAGGDGGRFTSGGLKKREIGCKFLE